MFQSTDGVFAFKRNYVTSLRHPIGTSQEINHFSISRTIVWDNSSLRVLWCFRHWLCTRTYRYRYMWSPFFFGFQWYKCKEVVSYRKKLQSENENILYIHFKVSDKESLQSRLICWHYNNLYVCTITLFISEGAG